MVIIRPVVRARHFPRTTSHACTIGPFFVLLLPRNFLADSTAAIGCEAPREYLQRAAASGG